MDSVGVLAANAVSRRAEMTKRVWWVRPSLPIVEQVPVAVPEDEQRRLARQAQRVRHDDPALSWHGEFSGGRVRPGVGAGPALLFEDHREIALFADRNSTALEYRPLLLAEDGDVLALSGPPDWDFEEYCRDILRLGHVSVLDSCGDATGSPRSVPEALLNHPGLLAEVTHVASRHAALTVIPYLATRSAWRLAATVAETSGAEVRVMAPSPELAQRVNDKGWFARRVAEVIGPDALPSTGLARTPLQLVTALTQLARHHARLVVKQPESAGGVGNIVIESELVRTLDPRALLAQVWGMTSRGGRGWTFPLLVGVWDDPVLDSPSVQVWIPLRGDGLPVVEGVFSQQLKGARSSFVGATPTSLSPAWEHRIAEEAVRIGYLFQELGYFGRCSFDAVLTGDDPDLAELHWVDCNGRWGGVSLAMSAANRLVGDWQRRPFVVVHRAALRLPPRRLPAVIEHLGADLYRPAGDGTGVVLLAPRRIVEGRGLNLMVMADDATTAAAEAEAVTARLLEGDDDLTGGRPEESAVAVA